ncbi:hypothetical protein [Bradyrhizobium sp. 195]|uniref:hypothetical protein n=1 Tax=Bradyrhizobium sp. 195 TaxID=2782662 RepID=UPI0020005D93|nr:hypothetical protein [Bradyrhizobium sp. 195]UPK26208.1 hypothetical protein IVB26_33815 [Bradyrhizobium sp. 195]
MILEHLAEAKRHIALGERHIARQIEIIDMLGRHGHPTELATQVLETYRELQITHLTHLDHIHKELEQEVAEPLHFAKSAVAHLRSCSASDGGPLIAAERTRLLNLRTSHFDP